MTYLLEREQYFRAPVEAIFPFFSDARNLERITPAWLGFHVLSPDPIEMAPGTRIDYRLQLAGLSLRWRTVIRDWEPGRRFVDEQERGPYALWRHEHVFTPLAGGTLMADRVEYALPFGPLGRLAHALWVHSALARIFDFRRAAVGELLPG